MTYQGKGTNHHFINEPRPIEDAYESVRKWMKQNQIGEYPDNLLYRTLVESSAPPVPSYPQFVRPSPPRPDPNVEAIQLGSVSLAEHRAVCGLHLRRAQDAERERNKLSDQCGALRTENDELLRENARLRRANERLERASKGKR